MSVTSLTAISGWPIYIVRIISAQCKLLSGFSQHSGKISYKRVCFFFLNIHIIYTTKSKPQDLRIRSIAAESTNPHELWLPLVIASHASSLPLTMTSRGRARCSRDAAAFPRDRAAKVLRSPVQFPSRPLCKGVSSGRERTLGDAARGRGSARWARARESFAGNGARYVPATTGMRASQPVHNRPCVCAHATTAYDR